MVWEKLWKEKARGVGGLVGAVKRAIIENAAAPDAAIALMMKTEPLMNGELEKQRLLYTFKTHIVTPETDEIGIGDIKPDPMTQAITLLPETYGLARTPPVPDVSAPPSL